MAGGAPNDIVTRIVTSPQPALTMSESIKQSLIEGREKIETHNSLLDFKTPKVAEALS